MTEAKKAKQLEHIDTLSNQGLDRILTRLDEISDQIDGDDTAGKIAIHAVERQGVLRELDRQFGSRPFEEPDSAEATLADYLCAIKESGGIDQYSPRALKEYVLNAYTNGTLLQTVQDSVARRNGPTQ